MIFFHQAAGLQVEALIAELFFK